ncbi:hypothetical protein B0H16DRAFT_1823494 [Mycena metata]|uniref:G domain-containing protein n=1 Tax=Mycena metata TaxID=1033252 RepID=A0AAD7GYJ5_9AGAR|nr:hypothetical protein B0H16DRAFT_1823494 [Mycena metata]
MTSATLPLTTEEILKHCGRFRILVVGKSGVGKSSLINYAFGVDLSHMGSMEYVTLTTRLPPHTTPVSCRVVETLPSGIKFMPSGEWLCISVPFAGGRVFETGDEQLLKLASGIGIPIVVVFTKFDLLISHIERHLTEQQLEEAADPDGLCEQQAMAEFKEKCEDPLHNIGPSLKFAITSRLVGDTGNQPAVENLINITQDLLTSDTGFVQIVSGMAQRASAVGKIKVSVGVGMKRYWRGLASSANFHGATLDRCLRAIHDDILLVGQDVQGKIKTLSQLVIPDESKIGSWFSNPDAVQGLVGLASLVVAGAAPVVAALTLSAMAIKFFTEFYTKSPEVLRALMGYIADLTRVMDHLFILMLGLKPPQRVTQDFIDMALENYAASGNAAKTHQEIRQYANNATFDQILRSDTAHRKLEELIEKYRADRAN